MVKIINSWAQGVVLAVVISTIIEIILPDGNNKKYVKTIIGIYILFTIVYPLITKISNKNIDINSIITSVNRENVEYQTDTNIILETNNYIEDTYIQKIEDDIKNKLLEKGYKVSLLDITIETENEEKYGQINEILIRIEKKEIEEKNNEIGKNTIDPISKIEISANNNTTSKDAKLENEEIKDKEIKGLKEYLNITYGTQIDRIYINE